MERGKIEIKVFESGREEVWATYRHVSALVNSIEEGKKWIEWQRQKERETNHIQTKFVCEY